MTASENELLQMQEETNRIVSEIQSQKLDEAGATRFIYALFILCGISMIFESFVRSYRAKKKEKKRAGEKTGDLTKKLLIVYGVHLLFVVLFCLICAYILGITGPYLWTLCLITVFMVEISPLFALNLKLNKKEKE